MYQNELTPISENPKAAATADRPKTSSPLRESRSRCSATWSSPGKWCQTADNGSAAIHTGNPSKRRERALPLNARETVCTDLMLESDGHNRHS